MYVSDRQINDSVVPLVTCRTAHTSGELLVPVGQSLRSLRSCGGQQCVSVMRSLARSSYSHAPPPRGPDGQRQRVHGVHWRLVVTGAGQVRGAGAQSLVQLHAGAQTQVSVWRELPGGQPSGVKGYLDVQADAERVPEAARLHS